ncbi:MAG: AhpC/TSA family protein [Chitinophagaceae bacterium]|nr:AhpC/TSA family protein [Chitinophagaceae bacterium]
MNKLEKALEEAELIARLAAVQLIAQEIVSVLTSSHKINIVVRGNKSIFMSRFEYSLFKPTFYMIRIVIMLLLFLLQKTKAQLTNSSFTINGKITTDSGRVKLLPVSDISFYKDTKIFSESALVAGGRFRVSGTIQYPQAFRLRLENSEGVKYISGIFFVEKGTNTIRFNSDSNWVVPFGEYKTMNEFRNSFLKYFSEVAVKDSIIKAVADSFSRVYGDKVPLKYKSYLTILQEQNKQFERGLFQSYVDHNPKSYVALWNLINYQSFEYSPDLDSIYNSFASELKNTYSAKAFAKRLLISGKTAPGNFFPESLFFNTDYERRNLKILLVNKKITLVDFWFNSCNPCISQFSLLRQFYSEYQNKGFNIIGISVDRAKDSLKWKQVISKEKLPWTQLIDLNSAAQRLGINAYPTNFLLDSSGKIVVRDISLLELEVYLRENLKE